jgi:hypothetical protein
MMEDLAHIVVERGETLWNQALVAWSSRYGSGERFDSHDNDFRKEYTEAESLGATLSVDGEESCEEDGEDGEIEAVEDTSLSFKDLKDYIACI